MNTTSPRRRRGARAIGALSVLAVSAGLTLAVPGTAAAAETATGGELDWGFKASFRSYLQFSGGVSSVADGASKNGDGTFAFSAGTGTVDGSSVDAAFAGSVNFLHVSHGFDITLSDLQVDIDGASGELIADTLFNGAVQQDVVLATLDLTGVSRQTTATGYSWSAIPTTATQNVTDIFGSSYPAGTALDALSFELVVPATDPGEEEPEPPAENEQDLTVVVPTVEPEPEPGSFGWSITGDGSAVSLGTAQLSNGQLVAGGQLKPVVVTDTRTTANAWSITAQVSDFTAGATTVSGRHLGWSPRIISAGGGAVAGAPVASGITSGDGLSTPAVLGSAANGHAAGTTTLGADLDLRLPSTTAAGTYGATLTLTALS